MRSWARFPLQRQSTSTFLRVSASSPLGQEDGAQGHVRHRACAVATRARRAPHRTTSASRPTKQDVADSYRCVAGGARAHPRRPCAPGRCRSATSSWTRIRCARATSTHPDELRIDLDPGPGVPFAQVAQTAPVARDHRAEHGFADLRRAAVVEQPEQQRADAVAVGLQPVAADDAAGGALVLDLDHLAAAAAVRRRRPAGGRHRRRREQLPRRQRRAALSAPGAARRWSRSTGRRQVRNRQRHRRRRAAAAAIRGRRPSARRCWPPGPAASWSSAPSPAHTAPCRSGSAGSGSGSGSCRCRPPPPRCRTGRCRGWCS